MTLALCNLNIILMNTSGKCQKNGQNRPDYGLSGFTLIEIMIVVAILGVISAVAVPNFIKARNSAQVKICIANLKQITGVKAQWAFEQRKANSVTPSTDELAPYFNSGALPPCPANGTYRIRRVSSNAGCSLYYSGHTMSNLDMDDDPGPE
jgi:prepilin-type N-terminal cleavage/methylation domain-containing protein